MELTTFSNPSFGSIRTLTIENEPWFVGKDVAEKLGYKRTADAMKDHVDDDDKRFVKVGEIPTLKTSNYGATLINESGLYSLILSSKLPTARQFKHWVTSEVLPAIRKSGSYAVPKGKELLALALVEANNVIESMNKENHELKIEVAKRNETIVDMTPKAIFADRICGATDTISMNELACLITQNGKPIGRNSLFAWMREKGYFFKTSREPKQKWVKSGLFKLDVRPVGKTNVFSSARVTGKGQRYFLEKFFPNKEEFDYELKGVTK
jgi:anti-repressor protein